jgi:hypothetical protein
MRPVKRLFVGVAPAYPARVMFWLGGFLSLEVTTSTPDALCPPLAEARAAIDARVGEVRGTYRVEFALVRADDGQQVLDLVVRDNEQEVLRRELPLSGVGCEDAAQAMALVVERYFDAIERPELGDQPPSPEPIPEIVAPAAPTQEQPAHRSRDSPPVENHRWRGRASFVYDREFGLAPALGMEWFPAALRLQRALSVGVTLDVAPFLTPSTQTVREEEITASTLEVALSLPFAASFEPWCAAVGPWAQTRLQRAEAESLAHSHTAYRALLGLGGFVELGWWPSSKWGVAASVAVGGQLVEAATRFVLVDADMRGNAVLVPESWFGQGRLTFKLRL